MAGSLIFYSDGALKNLEKRVKLFQDGFEDLLNDTFSEEEQVKFENLIEGIAAISIQPMISELSFEDFYVPEVTAEPMATFFQTCQSSIVVENLPFLNDNPFQVSYLLELLNLFPEVLVDRGGVNELLFRKDYEQELRKYKNMDSLATQEYVPKVEVKSKKQFDPIEYLIRDVYGELTRLRVSGKLPEVEDYMALQADKMSRVFGAFRSDVTDPSDLLKLTGLNPKDFDDNLERLKFYLRKLSP
ncbi:MAG TPA: hypothetical protein VNJ01_11315 [Bacteriovoracaceae bacterium]|nr:hypothetical protein [Bacteriovoracaceae bacterium]